MPTIAQNGTLDALRAVLKRQAKAPLKWKGASWASSSAVALERFGPLRHRASSRGAVTRSLYALCSLRLVKGRITTQGFIWQLTPDKKK